MTEMKLEGCREIEGRAVWADKLSQLKVAGRGGAQQSSSRPVGETQAGKSTRWEVLPSVDALRFAEIIGRGGRGPENGSDWGRNRNPANMKKGT